MNEFVRVRIMYFQMSVNIKDQKLCKEKKERKIECKFNTFKLTEIGNFRNTKFPFT